jgi:hypothetical protein
MPISLVMWLPYNAGTKVVPRHPCCIEVPLYLKDILVTINKIILTLEFSNKNSPLVYHQNIRGQANKTDELLITVKNVHAPHILCLNEHHLKLCEML